MTRLSRLVNASQNALNPRYFPEIVTKGLRKLRKTDIGSKEALDWAMQKAESFDRFASSLHSSLWADVQAEAQQMAVEANERCQAAGAGWAGGGSYPYLLFITRLLQPQVVVENGVSQGWSSYALLTGLASNGSGCLYSSDFPHIKLKNPEKYVGCVVPSHLHERWTLFLQGDKRSIPRILSKIDQVDLLHYDSDKSYKGRQFAINAITPKMRRNSVIVMDDIEDNCFFRDWVVGHDLSYRVFPFENKYLGIVGIG